MGAQIIELRGWLRISDNARWCFAEDVVHRPMTNECINEGSGYNEEPPDFVYYLDLDPLWLQQQGTDVNQIVRIGNLLDQTHDEGYSTSAPAAIKVELM
jgi:hypothetical protein